MPYDPSDSFPLLERLHVYDGVIRVQRLQELHGRVFVVLTGDERRQKELIYIHKK